MSLFADSETYRVLGLQQGSGYIKVMAKKPRLTLTEPSQDCIEPWLMGGTEKPQPLVYKDAKIEAKPQNSKRGLEPCEFNQHLKNKLEELMKDRILNWVHADGNKETKDKWCRLLNKCMEECAEQICIMIDPKDEEKLTLNQSVKFLFNYSQVAMKVDSAMEIGMVDELHDSLKGENGGGDETDSSMPTGAVPITGNDRREPENHTTPKIFPDQLLQSSIKSLGGGDKTKATKIPTICYSPVKFEKQRKGQGATKHSRLLHDEYKKEQDKLFCNEEGLPALLKKLPLQDMPVFDKKKIAPGQNEFGVEIDFYTCNVLHFCAKLIYKQGLLPNQDCIKVIAKTLLKCARLVMGRNIADWEIPHDTTSAGGLKKWKKHVIVFIDFAALLTSLIMLIKLCKTIDNTVEGEIWYKHFRAELKASKRSSNKEEAQEAKLIDAILQAF